MIWLAASAILLGIVAGLLARHDARRMSVGVVGTGAVAAILLAGVAALVNQVGKADQSQAILLVAEGLILLMVLGLILGVVLILNGIVVATREGRRIANFLSLALGLAMVAYVGLAIAALVLWSEGLFLVVLYPSLALGFLSFGFASFVVYSWVYQAAARRWKGPVEAVIVLGAGLIGGEVTPLLASRLDRGAEAWERARLNGGHPVLVVSGGQGADEARPEAAAMADYLRSTGVPPEVIVEEAASRTTAENLRNSAALLHRRGITGPVLAVTSNFHTLRAAILLRKTGLAGHALGAKTASYYWPSATIREYAAILRDHRGLTITGLALAAAPPAIHFVAAYVLH